MCFALGKGGTFWLTGMSRLSTRVTVLWIPLQTFGGGTQSDFLYCKRSSSDLSITNGVLSGFRKITKALPLKVTFVF